MKLLHYCAIFTIKIFAASTTTIMAFSLPTIGMVQPTSASISASLPAKSSEIIVEESNPLSPVRRISVNPSRRVEDPLPQTNEATSERSRSEQLEPDEAKTRQHVRNRDICRSFIPAGAAPDSFEYREGMDRCRYGTG